MKNLEWRIIDQQEHIKEIDDKVDTKEAINALWGRLLRVIQDLNDISFLIEKVEAPERKKVLEDMVTATWKLLLNLYEDGEIDDGFEVKTQTEIQKLSDEFNEFLGEYIQENRLSIHATVWSKYFEQNEWVVNTSEKVGSFITRNLAVDWNWSLLNNVWYSADGNSVIWTNSDGELVVYAVGTTPAWTVITYSQGTPEQYIYQGQSVREVWASSPNYILRWEDWSITETSFVWSFRIDTDWVIYYTGSNGIEGELIWVEFRVRVEDSDWNILRVPISELQRDVSVLTNDERASLDIWEALVSIIWSQNPPDLKFQQLIELWNTFESERSKIKYLAMLSNYLDEKYDQEQEATKASILNGLFENKSVDNLTILEQDIAGVCADHHRLVATIAESMEMQAGLVSVTSTWLHWITWLKTQKGFALIDYWVLI